MAVNFLLVFLGGGVGCMVRYFFGLAFQKTALTLPWATFVSNVSACLMFAAVIWFLNKGNENNALRLLLLTGFCGGLSTFSSFGFETFMLLKQGLTLYAILNIFFNTTACILIYYFFQVKES